MSSFRQRATARKKIPEQTFAQCISVGLRFLSYRPRTVREIELRLEKDFSHTLVEQTVDYLTELRYLDDASFCGQWVDSRERSRPRGIRLLKLELSRLGVEPSVIEAALQGTDERGNSLNAGRRYASRLYGKGSDFQEFRTKLGAYLQRRGFGYGTVAETVRELWAECAQNQPPSRQVIT